MVLPSMEYYKQSSIATIQFHINLSSPSVLEQIGFVILLGAKFGVDVVNEGRFWRASGKPFGHLSIKLGDYDTYMRASDHCRANLTEKGRVKKGYVGALDQADRGGRQARAVHEELLASEFSN